MLLTHALVALVAGIATTSDPVADPAGILPADTIIYIGTDSARASAHAATKTAMAKILREPEVRAFLQEPLSAAEAILTSMMSAAPVELGELPGKQLSLGWLGGLLMGGEEPAVGRAFMAITHIAIPVDATSMPDIGLIIGAELLDASDADQLKQLWSSLGEDQLEGTEEIHGITVASRTIEGTPLSLHMASVDNLVLLSLSREALVQVIARAKESKPDGSLAGSADYKELRGRSGQSEAGDIMSFVRIQPIVTTLRTGLQMAAASNREDDGARLAMTLFERLGVDCLETMGGTSRVDSAGAIHTIDQLTYNGTLPGLIPKLLSQSASRDLDLTGLESIPDTALGASLSVINGQLATIYDFAMDFIDTYQPGLKAEAEASLTGLLGGASLRDDVLANIDGQMISYSSQGSGMSPSPDWNLIAEVQRPEALIQVLATAVERLGQEIGFPIKVTQAAGDAEGIHNIDLSATPLGMQLSPAFVQVGDHKLSFSTSARQLKSTIQTPIESTQSLAKHQSLTDFSKPTQASVHLNTLSYTNVAAGFRAQYGPIAGMAPFLLGGVTAGLPIQLSKLPSSTVIEQHLGESFTATEYPEPGVVITRTTAQFQATDALPIVAIAGIIALGQSLGIDASASTEPVQRDPVDQALNDLKEIRAALTVYKIAMNGYPSSLDELVKPIPAYEGGALSHPLPLDPWGNAYQYSIEEHPTKHRPEPKLWSRGANGIDESGAGDDVVKF